MARGVTVCDWTKQVIPDDEIQITVEIGGEEFVFSDEGHTSMMALLHGNDPFAAHTFVPEDTSRVLTNEDLKPPRVTRADTKRVLAESTVDEEGTLKSLSEQRAEALKRLDVINAEIDLDLENQKAQVEGGAS